MKTSKFFENGRYIGPIIVIVGPTASGKTKVAIDLALSLPRVLERPEAKGEVISADSRAIYKYIDIGTAKPSSSEQKGVPHFGLDLIEPGENFTVADFKEYVTIKIQEIRERGHIPIIAGGTGLYVDAIVYDYKFNGESKDLYHGTDKANKNLQKGGSEVTRNEEIAKDRTSVSKDFKLFGVLWSSSELKQRIKLREEAMYCPELFKETEFLVGKYGWGSQAMKSNIYEYADKYLKGELSLDEAIEQNVYRDYHLAKRQMTWFKRNKEIKWCKEGDILSEILKIFA